MAKAGSAVIIEFGKPLEIRGVPVPELEECGARQP